MKKKILNEIPARENNMFDFVLISNKQIIAQKQKEGNCV